MENLRKLRVLYQTQAELLWKWRPGPGALAKRAGLSLLASIVAFFVVAWLLPGLLAIDSFGSGLVAILFISAVDLLVRPALLVLVANRSVALLVLLALGFQTLVVWALTPLIAGVAVEGGIIGAFVVSLFLGAFKGLTGLLVGLDEEGSYYSTLFRTLASRRQDATHTDEPGLVIIQTDGVAHDILAHAIRAGRVPNIARWVREGTHRLGRWEALLPPTTPASQAGILHGNNDAIPGFRWWEKEGGRLLVANHPSDATVMERRISDGEGLLSPGGASISNIFTGDAERAFLVQSTIRVKERGLGQTKAFGYYFLSPYDYLTMLAGFVAEVAKEMWQYRRQRRAGIKPLLHRKLPYPFVRAATNVALRAVGTSLLIEEMYRGTPVMYMDFTDYDEIAHHSGPERPESLDALDGIDRQLGILERAAEEAPRPYRFVLVADHGQCLGPTFTQLFGQSLENVVHSLMGGRASVLAATGEVEGWGPLNIFVGELTETGGLPGIVARSLASGRRDDGHLQLGSSGDTFTPRDASEAPASAEASGPEETAEQPDLVVAGSGNMAHIYFNALPERLSVEQIEHLHPGLPDALANHPGVGLLIARSKERGLLCVGRSGIHFLDDDRVEGSDPLAGYGPHAARAVKRLDELEHVGDIAVISPYDSDKGEVIAYEELVGIHGGLGGVQTQPHIVYPSDWEMDLAPLIGAPMVYQQIRRWMERELDFSFGQSSEGVAPDSLTAEAPPTE